MPARLPTEKRQAEIVAAALRLASERSPGQITTGEIAEAVGVTQGALFKHFSSKDAIWLAAMCWVHATLLQAVQEAAEGAASPRAALEAVFHAHVEFVVAHPGVPRVIFHELQQPGDSPAKREVRALLQAYRQLLLALLGAAGAQGQLRAGLDAEAAATAFLGLLQGLVMQSMLTGQPAAMRPLAGRVLALYLRGVGASS
ncbi:TetR/AcrR family transcriptional regulator [Inhella proteolytica]|uniref:TetR/AcrR family transcriptional regulator n=1 Tax=Inhella proteolytica TaxID=2795029 RepID=A0A931J5E6_9BURK|nr:TetR/AcrR family transcriptional regulator [Inhella proteolytica]MBH9578591.1 TetR/AcrR family transcriptional regulator [Inhella proteolytica]